MGLTFNALIAEIADEVREVFPWDVETLLANNPDTLLLDIREPDEFMGAYIEQALWVPRGILEAACDWGYSDTVPELASARDKPIIVLCRSGNRSILAAHTMQRMGYTDVYSLKTGIKGWNDADMPLVNDAGESVDADWAETFFNVPVKPEQML